MNLALCALLLLFPVLLQAQRFYTYVGRIETDSVLLAWGTTERSGNTIGRDSVPYGKAVVRVGDRQIFSERNWALIGGLQPDTEYSYEVTLGERRIGAGTVRTHPMVARKLAFFVLGDYGTGKRPQYEIAQAMGREFEKRSQSDNPIRFVLTTGDNIYADRKLGFLPLHSGNRDEHWGPKFFQPYERLLSHIPFYPTLGNHDSGESEPEGDLAVYLDNFFFPSAEPDRYYHFEFGGLAQFFALDTTSLARQDAHVDSLAKGGRQFQWLEKSLAASKARWRIAYFHHALFTAGPRHKPSLESLRPVADLFQKSGIQVVFSGHEHNFQYSERNEKTGNILYVITGGGSNVRAQDVRSHMGKSNIAGWANQPHFLLVEMEDRTMKITPLASQPLIVREKNGNPLPLPIVVAAAD